MNHQAFIEKLKKDGKSMPPHMAFSKELIVLHSDPEKTMRVHISQKYAAFAGVLHDDLPKKTEELADAELHCSFTGSRKPCGFAGYNLINKLLKSGGGVSGRIPKW